MRTQPRNPRPALLLQPGARLILSNDCRGPHPCAAGVRVLSDYNQALSARFTRMVKHSTKGEATLTCQRTNLSAASVPPRRSLCFTPGSPFHLSNLKSQICRPSPAPLPRRRRLSTFDFQPSTSFRMNTYAKRACNPRTMNTYKIIGLNLPLESTLTKKGEGGTPEREGLAKPYQGVSCVTDSCFPGLRLLVRYPRSILHHRR